MALFDLEANPDEDSSLINDPAAVPVLREMMERYAEPFLATPSARQGPHLVERQMDAANRA